MYKFREKLELKIDAKENEEKQKMSVSDYKVVFGKKLCDVFFANYFSNFFIRHNDRIVSDHVVRYPMVIPYDQTMHPVGI